MPSEREEARYWRKQLDEVQRGGLKTARESAGKWQATIAALLGVFGSVAFVKGPGTFKDLGASDEWEGRLFALLAAAAVLALIGVLTSAFAAQGFPVFEHFWTSVALRKASATDTKGTLLLLRAGQVATGIAAVVVIVGWLSVIYLGVATYPGKPATQLRGIIQLDVAKYQCVEFVNAAELMIKIGDASPVPMPSGAKIDRVVEKCPP